jgi:hypothetical protein
MINLGRSFSKIMTVSALIVFLLIPARLEASQKAFEIARPFERPDYVPAASDVTIRSLNFRPMDKNDPHDTIAAMQDFHATRLEWVYLRFNQKEKELINKVKRMGRVFGASGEPGTGVDVELAAGREYGANGLYGLNGDPVINVHSKDWLLPIYPGCVNNPQYIKNNLEYYVKNVEYGAQVLQRDGAENQYHYARTGEGCFCEYCMADFTEYLKKKVLITTLEEAGITNLDGFNYKKWLYENDLIKDNKAVYANNPLFMIFADFQEESNLRFFTDLRTAINMLSMKRIPFSHNNTSHQVWERSYSKAFDFAISELVFEYSNPVHIYDRACTARKLGQVQVFGTPKSMGKQYSRLELNSLKRRVIATGYASGGLVRVPWDMFEDTKDGRGRFFGKPEEYADLYAFVRANDRYLSGYQDAGAFGPGLEENPYGSEKPVSIESEGKDIYAFIRAVPGDKQAAVVIHLVDWNKQNKPFKLILNNKNFFDSNRLSVSMAVPVEYVKSEHNKAEKAALAMLEENEKLSGRQSSAFASFSKIVKLEIFKDNSKTAVNVPAIDPWAILIIDTE